MIETFDGVHVAKSQRGLFAAIGRKVGGLIVDRAAHRDMLKWLRDRAIEHVAADLQSFRGAGAGSLRLLPDSFFLSADFAAFATEFRGANIQEVHRHTLYSFKSYATGGATEMLFFDQNIGSATNGLGDTNMQVGGQMAGNESMVVMNIRVVPLPAQADYDAANTVTPVAFGQWTEILNRNCWLVLEISDKPYVTVGPLAIFPSGFGPGSVVAGAATVLRNVSFPGNGTPDGRSLWTQDPPLAILPNRTLRAYARWRTALAATTAGKLGVMLDGYRIRAVQ